MIIYLYLYNNKWYYVVNITIGFELNKSILLE